MEVTVRHYGAVPPTWERTEMWREIKGEGEEEIAVLTNGHGRTCRVVISDGKALSLVK